MGARVAARAQSGRSRLWLLLPGTIVIVLVIGALTWLDRRDPGPSAPTSAASGSALPVRTVKAGAVTIKVEPRRLDAAGAVFKVSFDTHSVDLDQDLARQARLVVSGASWPVVGWSGDGPGGHHREGELAFTAAGTAGGAATLTIDGFPEPVTVTWDLAS